MGNVFNSKNKSLSLGVTCVDNILVQTKQINGSTDFGAIGATTLGNVKVLNGGILKKNRIFDISALNGKERYKLKTVRGKLIVNPRQYCKIDFSKVHVTDGIYVKIEGKNRLPNLIRVDKEPNIKQPYWQCI